MEVTWQLFHIVHPLAYCGLKSEEFSHIQICSTLKPRPLLDSFPWRRKLKINMVGVKMWLWGLVRNKSCISRSWVGLSFSRRVNKSVKQNKQGGIDNVFMCSFVWVHSLYYFNHALFVFLSSELFPPSSPLPSSPPHFILSLPLWALSPLIKPNLLPYLVCVHIFMCCRASPLCCLLHWNPIYPLPSHLFYQLLSHQIHLYLLLMDPCFLSHVLCVIMSMSVAPIYVVNANRERCPFFLLLLSVQASSIVTIF